MSLNGPSHTGVCTHLGHPVFKRTVQWRLHGQTIYSRITVQKPDISLENRLRRRQWCTKTVNGAVPENWFCLLFSNESRFSLAYCDGTVRVLRTAGEKYIPECLRMVNRNGNDSVMLRGSRSKRECGQLCQNIIRKSSWFCRKHIWRHKSSICYIYGERNHPFVFHHDDDPTHTGVELSHGLSSRTNPPFNGHPSRWT